MIRARHFSRLVHDRTGSTIIEFAICAPVFLVMLFAAFDFGHTIYAGAVLQGAVQQAGRNAGLESGKDSLTSIDSAVMQQIKNVVPNGAILTSRKNYKDFNTVGKPEDFVDANSNGQYDPKECFTDANGNGVWDADRGVGGIGGANDVVLYTATLTYDRLVPLWKMIGSDKQMVLTASTTLRNQPFGDQASRPQQQICP